METETEQIQLEQQGLFQPRVHLSNDQYIAMRPLLDLRVKQGEVLPLSL